MAEDSESQVKVVTPKWYTINRSLLPVKGFYFFVLAAVGDLLPYIPLYMKELKLSTSETGIIYGVMPFVGFFARPLIGALADRTQKHKLVLACCSLFTGIFYLLILVIPSKTSSDKSPIYTSIKTNVRCNQFDSYIMDCYKNDTSSQTVCPLSFERYIELLKNETSKQSHKNNFEITLESSNNNFSNVYNVINEDVNNSSCTAHCHYKTKREYTTKACFTNQVQQMQDTCYDVEVTLNKVPDLVLILPNISGIMNHEIVQDRQQSDGTICRDFDLKSLVFKGQQYWQMLCNEETEMSCQLRCTAIQGQICPSSSPLDHGQNMMETFWLFLVIYLFANIAFSPVISLGDAMAYDILGEQRNRWGMQRLFGTIGFAIFAITSTFIMYALPIKENEQVDFSVSFYVFGVLFLIVAIISLLMPISEDLVCSQMLKNLSKLFCNPEILIFLIIILIFGMFTGAIETFLFWYLKDLGNWSSLIAGLALVTNCTAEVPLLLVSGKIIKRIGQIPILYLTLGAYAARFLFYSFLENPWVVLPVELLHGLTFGLMYAAATSYASIIAPQGMSATIQGLIGGIHFGFGKGIGSLITGVLFSSSVLGGRWTFRLYGILSVVFLILFLITNKICFKDKRKMKERENKTINTANDSSQESEDHLLDNVHNDMTGRKKMEEIELNDR